MNGQNDTISILEAILVNMTPSSKEKNQNMYPFPLEISISLILSVVYRQNGDYQKAINLLTNLISRIQKLPFINDRFSDYLSVSYLNLAYTYHSSSNPLKVIETVNESFSNSNVNYTRTTFSHLLFRKGLSLFILGDSDHEAFLITALSLMDEDTRNMIEHHLLKNYNYVIKKK